MTTQAQSIQTLIQTKNFYGNASKMDFYSFSNLIKECYSKNAICLDEMISPHLTGAELLYYPTLTQHMRKICSGNYPKLTREYKIFIDSMERKIGNTFIRYFCTELLSAFEAFAEETKEVNATVEQLINQYGNERVMPVIDTITKQSETDIMMQTLTINDITWTIDDQYARHHKTCVNTLNLRALLSIDRRFECVRLEEAVLGTPFVGIRLATHWRLKGRVHWYNLDTRQLEKPKKK